MMLGTLRATFNTASNFSFAAILFPFCELAVDCKEHKREKSNQINLTVQTAITLCDHMNGASCVATNDWMNQLS